MAFDPTVIFVTSNLHEANLVKGLLEANGVEVFIYDDNISRLNPLYIPAVGGIKLVVSREQPDLANEVLKEYRRTGEGMGVSLNPVLRCPGCSVPADPGVDVCGQCGLCNKNGCKFSGSVGCELSRNAVTKRRTTPMKTLAQKIQSQAHKMVRAKVRGAVEPGAIEAIVEQELHNVLSGVIDASLVRERDALLNRAPYERSEARAYRNGFKPARLGGVFSALFVRRPVLRGKTPPSPLLSALRRGGNRLLEILASRFWLRGASTRAVAQELNAAFGARLSSPDVSRITNALVPEIDAWLARPVPPDISYLFLDALYLPARKDTFTARQALLAAVGMSAGGQRHVLGFLLGDRENADAWISLIKELLSRGLKREGLRLVISDDHKAIDAAVAQHLGIAHQFCVVHKMRNALVRVAGKHRGAFYRDFKAIFWADSKEKAFLALGTLQERWQRLYPKATQIATRDPERFLRFFEEPPHLWTTLRSSNLIERFNRELRRRLNPAGAMQTENELWKIVWCVSVEQEKRWAKRRLKGLRCLVKNAA